MEQPAMIDPTLTDDALRKLIADATALLDARRRSDLASLIHGMTDAELRDVVRQACEELDSRRPPSTPTGDEFTYRFQMRPSHKGKPEIIRYIYVEGQVVQITLDLKPGGSKGTILVGEHVLRNGDFIVVKNASGMTMHSVPFNGTYISDYRPKKAVPDVSDDPNILDRLYRYVAGVRRELEPDAKKIYRSTLDMIRYYRAELKKFEKSTDRDAVNAELTRQFIRRYQIELEEERQYLDTLARFFDWMGATVPRS
jgi:hypothetical protein